MRILDGRVHLGYCTNVHAGERWPEVRANVVEEVTAVRDRLGSGRRFGVGLRLSAAAADELWTRPGQLDAFAAELDALGLYVFTLNGAAYGRFGGGPVKRAVYRPDWRERERLRYTEVLAAILDRLLPAGVHGSINTIAGGFGPDTRAGSGREWIVEQLLRCAASLWRLRERGGRTITLAPEPEPWSMLETSAEAVELFEGQLWRRPGVARMAALTGLAPAQAELALRRHLGLCVDACHAAVAFEQPRTIVERLRGAGLRLAKLQVSAGLRVAPVTEAALAALRAFVEPIYLHPVVARCDAVDGGVRRYLDLPAALRAGACERRGAIPCPSTPPSSRRFARPSPSSGRCSPRSCAAA